MEDGVVDPSACPKHGGDVGDPRDDGTGGFTARTPHCIARRTDDDAPVLDEGSWVPGNISPTHPDGVNAGV